MDEREPPATGQQQWLPPQPPGPGAPVSPPPGPPPQAQQATPTGADSVQGYGFAPGYGPGPWQQPPWQYGYQQPPPYGYPPQGWGPQPWQQQERLRQANNDPAIAGLSLSLCGLCLLFLSMGLSAFLVSPVAGGLGIFFGRRGVQKVDRGETPRYRSAGKAGIVLGIITLVLSLIALAIWIAVIATNPDLFDESDEDDFEDDFGGRAGAASAALAVRLIASLAA